MPLALELRASVRGLIRSPGYASAVVLSLALGIGSAASAFGVLDAVRFRALPFPDADRLVSIVEMPADLPGEWRTGGDVSYETFANLIALHPPRALDAVAGFTAGGKALATSAEPILLIGGGVFPDLLSLPGAGAGARALARRRPARRPARHRAEPRPLGHPVRRRSGDRREGHQAERQPLHRRRRDARGIRLRNGLEVLAAGGPHPGSEHPAVDPVAQRDRPAGAGAHPGPARGGARDDSPRGAGAGRARAPGADAA